MTPYTPWWRRVLDLEPVRAVAIVRAALVLIGLLLAGFGVAVPESVEPWLVGVVVAFYALVEAVTAAVTRARVTPTAKVMAQRDDDGVPVAGPASPLPDGTPVATIPVDPL